MIDCTNEDVSGTYYNAWHYAQFSGIAKDEDYHTDGTCTYDKTKGQVRTMMPEPYEKIYSNSEYMMEAVDEKPTAVMINASSRVFQTYKGGVLSAGCDHSNVNYSALVIGYDSTAETPYWLLRN